MSFKTIDINIVNNKVYYTIFKPLLFNTGRGNNFGTSITFVYK